MPATRTCAGTATITTTDTHMGPGKGEHFATRDFCLDYDFEEVTYRRDHQRCRIYARSYGKAESLTPVAHDNRLFNDALRFGREIAREEYERGFPRGWASPQPGSGGPACGP